MFAQLAPLPQGLQPKDATTVFQGGLDLETPVWWAAPGTLRDARNYEIAVEGGYRDVSGYERFDGQAAPSDASFTILDVAITGSIQVGDTVTGATTGATGVVIAIAAYDDAGTTDVTTSVGFLEEGFVEEGFLFTSEETTVAVAEQYLVLTKVTGSFDNASENLEVSASVEAVTTAKGYADSAPTSKLTAQYKNLAADSYRSDIAAVPGEGDVWGGFTLGDTKYAIRNHTGGATAKLWKSTAAGWVEVALGLEIAFTSGGTYEMAIGDTITGAVSGATAVLTHVQITSGTFAGGDAAGWLHFLSQTGTFQAENLNVGANTNVATIAGDSTTKAFQPDGRLDHVKSNFASPQGSERVYGTDGVNFGWEFDGTDLVFIRTGMTDDTPDHVAVHKGHLFFGFDGSVQHSGIGAPYSWSVVLGASEIATESPVTAFQVQPGAEGNAALLVACRQRFYVLYGNDSSDWNLVRYREKVGAYEWTLQELAYSLFLDDRGITDLRTVQAFGNFDHSSLSNKIRSLLNTKRTLATASCVVRDKNQYRLFFTDDTAIYVTMAGSRLMGMMPVTLNHTVTTIWSEEDSSGNEEIFFGSDDGFVYQMEKGTSFDGDNIYGFLYTHFDHNKAVEWNKAFEGPVTLQGKNTGYAEFSLAYELSWGGSDTRQPDQATGELPGARGAEWDAGLSWDSGLTWDTSATNPAAHLDLEGEGKNIAWVISKNSDYMDPVLISGLHYRYIPRVQSRG